MNLTVDFLLNVNCSMTPFPLVDSFLYRIHLSNKSYLSSLGSLMILNFSRPTNPTFHESHPSKVTLGQLLKNRPHSLKLLSRSFLLDLKENFYRGSMTRFLSTHFESRHTGQYSFSHSISTRIHN